MSRMSVRLASCCAFLMTVASAAGTAWSCSVPVYRYALERWPADPYRVVIFHREPLATEQKQLAEQLGPYGLAGKKHANLTVRTVDLDKQPAPEMQRLWQSQKNATLPWMVVRYPATANYAPAWSGKLTKQAVETLIDSPARREIAQRILAGQTAVWILLESGDKKKDEAAYQRLKKRLAVEENTLKLPEIDEGDLLGGDAQKEAENLKVEFSIIRVSRDDPKEAMLVEMLLGSEGSGPESLRDPQYVDQTMAFPIFGRGRIRYGLVGSGIAAETIHEACAYLCGPCSCQIKQDVINRGMDLVMAVDWKRQVIPTIRDKADPPLVGLGNLKPIKVPSKTQTPIEAPKPASSTDRAGTSNSTAKTADSGTAPQNNNDTADSAGKNVIQVKDAGPSAEADNAAATSTNETRSASQESPSSPAASTASGDIGHPLYRNIFLIVGLIAVIVVGGSFFLASHNG